MVKNGDSGDISRASWRWLLIYGSNLCSEQHFLFHRLFCLVRLPLVDSVLSFCISLMHLQFNSISIQSLCVVCNSERHNATHKIVKELPRNSNQRHTHKNPAFLSFVIHSIPSISIWNSSRHFKTFLKWYSRQIQQLARGPSLRGLETGTHVARGPEFFFFFFTNKIYTNLLIS